MTVKARLDARTLVALAALVATAATASAQAAVTRTPPRPDTPRLMVQVFGSADKVAGPLASDELRERLIRAFPSRILWVIDRKDIIAVLEQSGYDTTAQLAPSDESQLAKAQRADEYIRGRVVREGDMYKVEAMIVLTRDNSLTQPLPASTGNRADRAVANLVKSIQDARKQLDDEKKCMAAARDNKYAEALAAAEAGILEYPQGTLVRYCKMNVLIRQEASDSLKLAAANEILAIDPNSKNALAIAADANRKLGNAAAANDLLLRLLAANPTDAQLANQVIEALAASGDFERARAVVFEAVAQNPGDMALIGLQFKILSAAKDYKNALKTGEEMVQMDTSLADVPYYQRMVGLYDADSQPQKAAEMAARATQKYPQDADLWQLYSATLKKAGQVQQSIAAAKRALEVNPQIANGWTQVAIAYNELNMPDSALIALRAAKAAGDNGDNIGQISLLIGNRLYRAAVADSNKTVAAFQAAQPYLYFADSATATNVAQRTNAKLLIGVTHFYIAQVIAGGLQASKSCEEAKMGQAAAVESMIYVQQGGRDNPQTAGQLMQGLNQLSPYFEQSVKTLCK
jgi:tetratricopeptide (TPR) repeat protein